MTKLVEGGLLVVLPAAGVTVKKLNLELSFSLQFTVYSVLPKRFDKISPTVIKIALQLYLAL